MGTEHCLGMWWVPPSLRVGTQSHSFIQSPILSLYKYWHMLDICKCSCIFRRKKRRKNGRKERRKGRKGERRTGRRRRRGAGERESRLGKGLMNVQTTKHSWEYLLYQPSSVRTQRHRSNLGPVCSQPPHRGAMSSPATASPDLWEGAGCHWGLFRDSGRPAAAMLSPAPVLGATLFLSTWFKWRKKLAYIFSSSCY